MLARRSKPVFFIAFIFLWPFAAMSEEATYECDVENIENGLPVYVPADPDDLKFYEESRALIIYNSEYDNDRWTPLSQAKIDAEVLTCALRRRGFAVEIFPNKKGAEIREKVTTFLKRAPSDSRNIIYIGGHGFRDNDEFQTGYLVPTDAPDPSVDLELFRDEVAIKTTDFSAWASNAPEGHTLLLLDSCFSGSHVTEVRVNQQPPRSLPPAQDWWDSFRTPKFQVLAASDDWRPIEQKTNMVEILLAGLFGEVQEAKRGFLTADDLAQYFQHEVRAQKNYYPLFGRIPLRNPRTNTDYADSGSMIFLTPVSEVLDSTTLAPPDAEVGSLSDPIDSVSQLSAVEVPTAPLENTKLKIEQLSETYTPNNNQRLVRALLTEDTETTSNSFEGYYCVVKPPVNITGINTCLEQLDSQLVECLSGARDDSRQIYCLRFYRWFARAYFPDEQYVIDRTEFLAVRTALPLLKTSESLLDHCVLNEPKDSCRVWVRCRAKTRDSRKNLCVVQKCVATDQQQSVFSAFQLFGTRSCDYPIRLARMRSAQKSSNSSSLARRLPEFYSKLLDAVSPSDVQVDTRARSLETALQNVTVYYYKKVADEGRVVEALRNLGVAFEARTGRLSGRVTNGIACDPNADPIALKAVAIALIENDVDIRLIRQFISNKEAGRIEILTFEDNPDSVGTPVQNKRPITISQIENFVGCPVWFNN